jgi:hypothetical protein
MSTKNDWAIQTSRTMRLQGEIHETSRFFGRTFFLTVATLEEAHQFQFPSF